MQLQINPKFFLTVFLTLFLQSAICQQRQIEITKYNKRTVPIGKEWVISNSKTYKAMFSEGVFRSGTACNASFHSNPSFIFGICFQKDSSSRQTIGFTFKELSQIDDNVYLIKPFHFLNDAFELRNSVNWIDQKREIVFEAGTEVWTYSCLSDIIIEERPITIVRHPNGLITSLSAQQHVPKHYISTNQQVIQNTNTNPKISYTHNRVTIKVFQKQIEFSCPKHRCENIIINLTDEEYTNGIKEDDYLISNGPIKEVYFAKDVNKIQVEFRNGNRIIYSLSSGSKKRE